MRLELTPEQMEEFKRDKQIEIQLSDSNNNNKTCYIEVDKYLDFLYFEYASRGRFGLSFDIEEIDKFKAQRPRNNYSNTPMCPCCGTYLIYNFEHCPKCGQKIDYSEKGVV